MLRSMFGIAGSCICAISSSKSVVSNGYRAVGRGLSSVSNTLRALGNSYRIVRNPLGTLRSTHRAVRNAHRALRSSGRAVGCAQSCAVRAAKETFDMDYSAGGVDKATNCCAKHAINLRTPPAEVYG